MLCALPGCTKQPVFGLEEDDKALFCNAHRDKEKHVDVVNKRCGHPGETREIILCLLVYALILVLDVCLCVTCCALWTVCNMVCM